MSQTYRSELLIGASVPILKQLGKLPLFPISNGLIVELQNRYNLIPSNDDHLICLLGLLHLYVSEADFLYQALLFQLFNVF